MPPGAVSGARHPPEPTVTEMKGADRVHKLALLHVLGMRSDPTVDAALLKTLQDPELTASSAYLLGAPAPRAIPTATATSPRSAPR